MSDVPTYVLEREFDAPRELVWKVWTEAELLPRWYGPGVETIVHHLEVKPGGLWLGEMRMGGRIPLSSGSSTRRSRRRSGWCGCTPSATQDWNVTANPMMPDWPRVLLTTVTFEEDGGRTRLRLTWAPHDASAAETAAFAGAMERPGPGLGRRHGADRRSC